MEKLVQLKQMFTPLHLRAFPHRYPLRQGRDIAARFEGLTGKVI